VTVYFIVYSRLTHKPQAEAIQNAQSVERERYVLLNGPRCSAVSKAINRHISRRNKLCHMTFRLHAECSNPAYATPWDEESQMPEFANLIGSMQHLSEVRLGSNCGKKEFSWATPR